MNADIQCFNIEDKVAQIKKSVLGKTKLLLNLFYEKKIIAVEGEENISINNWLAKQIITIEHGFEQSEDYVYWVSGGLSWKKWYELTTTKIDEEEKVFLLNGNYDVRYIYYEKEELLKEKIKQIYKIIEELQKQLPKDMKTTIITTNFSYDTTENFIEKNKMLNKKTYSIKLILNNIPEIQGGARKPRKSVASQSRPLFNLLNKQLINKEPIPDDDYILYKEKLNEKPNIKTIVEFNFDLFKQSSTSKANRETEKLFTINLFKNKYLNISPFPYTHTDKYDIIEGKLNTLNDLGLITYSYLHTTDREDNLGFNVDLYRQSLFIQKQRKRKIAEYFKKILRTYYDVFLKTNFYNMFFTEKIDQIIYKYSSDLYEPFIDYIERWLMSMFRPSINSFIVEINRDLAKYNIKLFIAGGDAMRRFDYNISSTKDIDVKLYIGNIQELSGSRLSYEDLRDDVKRIIIKHIVKLRNYLEINFRNIFTNITKTINETTGQKEIQKVNYADTPILFTMPTTKETFTIRFVSKPEENTYHFRTREIKKSDKFPVDLFSIDYNATIIKTKQGSTHEKKYILNISLLDVVLQEDNFDPRYCHIGDDGIPIANRYFLEYDLQLTYTTEERGIARISSGKFMKDISRYKRMCSLPEIKEIKEIKEINYTGISDKIETLQVEDDIKTKFYIIIYKLEKNITFNIFDVIICIQLIPFLDKLDDITFRKMIEDIAYFRVNIYNEELNKIDMEYYKYSLSADDAYYKLFETLVFKDDGEQKHYISFTKLGVERRIKYEERLKTEQIAAPGRGAPKPKAATAPKARRKLKSSSSSSPPPQPKVPPPPTHGRSTRAATRAASKATK